MRSSDRHAAGQERAIWPPEPGYFQIRLAPRAWPVPAQIIHHDDGTWQAVIDGKDHEPHADPAIAPRVADVWLGLRIDRATYDYLLALKAHFAAHGPADHPSLNPTVPIHVNRLQPL